MNDSAPNPGLPLTLMTVHAHPDDETITTGGVIAKAVRDGHRVVLITATRGEQGEIVVPGMDTPDNHRRLGEIRMGELEAAMAVLGVTEWDNLGYRDSDMKGRVGNVDPRSFARADFDEAVGRLVWFIRRHRPHVMTTYDESRGYDHPGHLVADDVRAARGSRGSQSLGAVRRCHPRGACGVGGADGPGDGRRRGDHDPGGRVGVPRREMGRAPPSCDADRRGVSARRHGPGRVA